MNTVEEMLQRYETWVEQAEARLAEWTLAFPGPNYDGRDNLHCCCMGPHHDHTDKYKRNKPCGRLATHRYPLDPRMHSPRNFCTDCTSEWLHNQNTATGSALP